ncbi:MAG: MFS transporter [Chloroflexi bacterium]|nr:MFS transporter [Chloroflexota bacterium]
MTEYNPAKGKVYYGWIVVATCFIIFTVAFGIQLSFGIFLKPLQEAFGWSRATISWAMTFHLIVFGLCLIPVGWAIDRISSRVLFTTGAILIGISMVLSSLISEPWQLYVLYGLPLGVGIATCGPAILAIVTRWFPEHRGIALGIASAGVGFGTMIGAPITNFLIVMFDWRNSFVILGVLSFVILLGCAYLMRNASQQMADHVSNTRLNPALRQPKGMTFRQALRTKTLLMLVVAQTFAIFGVRVILVHIAPHATDMGISDTAAALALGAVGAFSMIGRLVMGFFQDRIGAKQAMLLCLTIQALSMAALPFIRSDLLFFVFAIIFGFTYGGDVPQVPAITAQFFGLASLGVLYGLITTVGNVAGAVGPILAGYAYDTTGTYTLVFLGIAASLFLSSFLVWRLKLKADPD